MEAALPRYFTGLHSPNGCDWSEFVSASLDRLDSKPNCPGSGRPAWWLSSGPPPTFSGRRIPSTGPSSGTSSSTLSTTSSRLLDLRRSCTIFGNLSLVFVLKGRFIFQWCATFGSDLRRTKLRPLLLFFIRINLCGCLWVCGRCFGCECTGGGG